MIREIRIGENRNKTMHDGRYRRAYNKECVFARFSATRGDIFTGGCYLIYPCLISHIERKEKEKYLICDINVWTTYQ